MGEFTFWIFPFPLVRLFGHVLICPTICPPPISHNRWTSWLPFLSLSTLHHTQTFYWKLRLCPNHFRHLLSFRIFPIRINAFVQCTISAVRNGLLCRISSAFTDSRLYSLKKFLLGRYFLRFTFPDTNLVTFCIEHGNWLLTATLILAQNTTLPNVLYIPVSFS